ncbi:ATP F0F1 synthase subunit B [Aestuariivirga litoralis]|uniref:F0F1 ATP synthase subunit B family protein n=1 Tax=Aestuariivirga litoralis TaxID=2650924 RepID=UPI0018C68AD0|nr:ATP F0F1 synthase subunit B [Aestuariivirga litoralis]MBG1233343.1 ATP F0F1 synthase subunit B [Aestuariivirga litoralis]
MATTTETTESTGHEEGGKFPPLDTTTFPSQLFWLVIFFALLYLLLSRLVLPRFGKILGARKGQIDGDIARAQALKDETEAALKSYEKALADARNNANDIAKKTRDDVTAEVTAEQHKLDASLATKIKTAEDKIAKAKAKAMDAVNDIAADSAADIVSSLTGGKVLKTAAAKAVTAAAKG